MSKRTFDNKGELLLIRRIRKGEEYAFEIAFLKYHAPLCRYIWKYVRSEEVSKEIVQEIFAEVWEHRKNLNPSGHLRGFLYEVARNKALDYIKHQKIADKYLSEAKQQKKEIFYENLHGQKNDNWRLYEMLNASIKDLPPRGRQIFELNREEGLTYKEISEYLEISVKTVETHMRRVLKTLRESMSAYMSTILFSGLNGFGYFFL